MLTLGSLAMSKTSNNSIISRVGCRMGLLIDVCNRQMKCVLCAAAFAATISASHEESAIDFCLADFTKIGWIFLVYFNKGYS